MYPPSDHHPFLQIEAVSFAAALLSVLQIEAQVDVANLAAALLQIESWVDVANLAAALLQIEGRVDVVNLAVDWQTVLTNRVVHAWP